MTASARTSQIEIEFATRADAADVADIARRTFRAAFADDNDAANIDAYVSRAFNLAQIEMELGQAHSRFYLIRDPDGLLAYAKLRDGEPADGLSGARPTELQRIYVDKSRAPAGTGSVLMRRIVDDARETGHDALWLAVWERNAGAIRFYKRHGFRVVGGQVFMMGPERQTDLVLARSLR